MENNICLDTDFLVAFLRNDPEAVQWIKQNEEKCTLATTTINLFELHHGAAKSNKKEQNKEKVNQLGQRLIQLTLSAKSAEKAGELLAHLEKTGQPIHIKDILIGSITLAEGFAVKTNNKKHFERIDGLNVL